jgi:hypothetical protein
MELQDGNAIGRFIMTLFIFLCLLALAPMLYSGIVFMKGNLLCSESYSFICFVGDAMLPLLAIVILSMLIGFIKGRN